MTRKQLIKKIETICGKIEAAQHECRAGDEDIRNSLAEAKGAALRALRYAERDE